MCFIPISLIAGELSGFYNDIVNCKGNPINIHFIPYFNEGISSIIDVSFEKN